MAEEVKLEIPHIYVSDLEAMAKKVKNVTGKEDTELTFEFIIASFFPTSWKSIQEEMNRQYTRGYIQGRIDKEKEMESMRYQDVGDDADCFCD